MPNTNEKAVQRKARYLQSIIGIFIIPAALLLGVVWKKMSKKAFFISASIIALIGWAWSWTVTSHGWWSFGDQFMLGWDVIAHLPPEEVLFYPFGGILTIFLYIAVQRFKWVENKTSAPLYWGYLIIGTLAFGGIAFATRANHPNYLYSQLITYNLICCLCLAPFVAKDINLVAMLAPIVVLLPVGYFWDFFALKYGLWDFHAITQIRIGPVPLDEFNFFFFAEPSAISIYLVVCRFLKVKSIN